MLHHHLIIGALNVICNLLAYYGVLPAAAGWPRLVLSAPLIALHFILPACVQSFYGGYLPCCIVFLQTTFLGTFKVLALCLNRGPLSDKSLKQWQFHLLYSTPLYPKHGAGASGKQVHTLRELLPFLGFSVVKMVLLAIMTYVLTTYTQLSMFPKYLAWSVLFYLLLSIILDSAAPFSVMLLGLPLQPSFQQPYLASSFRDLWSRRWNLTISCTLRDVLYEPLCEGSWVRRTHEGAAKKDDDLSTANPSAVASIPPAGLMPRTGAAAAGEQQHKALKQVDAWKKHVGSLLVFFTSGVMHELWLRYFCGRFVGKQLAFFMLQMPAIVVQDALLLSVPNKVRQQRWWRLFQWLSTLTAAVGMSHLFWSSFEECGMAEGLWDLRTILLPWLD